MSGEVIDLLIQYLAQVAKSEAKVELLRQDLVSHRQFNQEEAFRLLDKSSQNSFSVYDLASFLQENAIELTKEELCLLFSHMDTNHDGLITWEEYLNFFLSKECSFNELDHCSRQYNTINVCTEIQQRMVMLLVGELDELKALEKLKSDLYKHQYFDMRKTFNLIDTSTDSKKGWLDLRDFYDFLSSEMSSVTFDLCQKIVRRVDKAKKNKVDFMDWQRCFTPFSYQYSALEMAHGSHVAPGGVSGPESGNFHALTSQDSIDQGSNNLSYNSLNTYGSTAPSHSECYKIIMNESDSNGRPGKRFQQSGAETPQNHPKAPVVEAIGEKGAHLASGMPDKENYFDQASLGQFGTMTARIGHHSKQEAHHQRHIPDNVSEYNTRDPGTRQDSIETPGMLSSTGAFEYPGRPANEQEGAYNDSGAVLDERKPAQFEEMPIYENAPPNNYFTSGPTNGAPRDPREPRDPTITPGRLPQLQMNYPGQRTRDYRNQGIGGNNSTNSGSNPTQYYDESSQNIPSKHIDNISAKPTKNRRRRSKSKSMSRSCSNSPKRALRARHKHNHHHRRQQNHHHRSKSKSKSTKRRRGTNSKRARRRPKKRSKSRSKRSVTPLEELKPRKGNKERNILTKPLDLSPLHYNYETNPNNYYFQGGRHRVKEHLPEIVPDPVSVQQMLQVNDVKSFTQSELEKIVKTPGGGGGAVEQQIQQQQQMQIQHQQQNLNRKKTPRRQRPCMAAGDLYEEYEQHKMGRQGRSPAGYATDRSRSRPNRFRSTRPGQERLHGVGGMEGVYCPGGGHQTLQHHHHHLQQSPYHQQSPHQYPGGGNDLLRENLGNLGNNGNNNNNPHIENINLTKTLQKTRKLLPTTRKLTYQAMNSNADYDDRAGSPGCEMTLNTLNDLNNSKNQGMQGQGRMGGMSALEIYQTPKSNFSEFQNLQSQAPASQYGTNHPRGPDPSEIYNPSQQPQRGFEGQNRPDQHAGYNYHTPTHHHHHPRPSENGCYYQDDLQRRYASERGEEVHFDNNQAYSEFVGDNMASRCEGMSSDKPNHLVFQHSHSDKDLIHHEEDLSRIDHYMQSPGTDHPSGATTPQQALISGNISPHRMMPGYYPQPPQSSSLGHPEGGGGRMQAMEPPHQQQRYYNDVRGHQHFHNPNLVETLHQKMGAGEKGGIHPGGGVPDPQFPNGGLQGGYQVGNEMAQNGQNYGYRGPGNGHPGPGYDRGDHRGGRGGTRSRRKRKRKKRYVGEIMSPSKDVLSQKREKPIIVQSQRIGSTGRSSHGSNRSLRTQTSQKTASPDPKGIDGDKENNNRSHHPNQARFGAHNQSQASHTTKNQNSGQNQQKTKKSTINSSMKRYHNKPPPEKEESARKDRRLLSQLVKQSTSTKKPPTAANSNKKSSRGGCNQKLMESSSSISRPLKNSSISRYSNQKLKNSQNLANSTLPPKHIQNASFCSKSHRPGGSRLYYASGSVDDGVSSLLENIVNDFRLVESAKARLASHPSFSIIELFEAVDYDREQAIDIVKLEKFLKIIKADYLEEDLMLLLRRHDKDEDLKLCFKEFYSMIAPKTFIPKKGKKLGDHVNTYRKKRDESSNYEYFEALGEGVKEALLKLVSCLLVTEKNDDVVRDIIGPRLYSEFKELEAVSGRGCITNRELMEFFGRVGVKLSNAELMPVVERYDLRFGGKVRIEGWGGASSMADQA